MVDNYTQFAQKKKLNKQIRKEKKVASRIASNILTVIFSITFVVALVLGSAIIFHNVYFQSFFVNGQSMYPTLNGNATYSDGSLIGPTQTRGDNGNIVEYGIMDTHKRAIDNINRFDIIIVSYNENDTKDKIKRVIALPGEEFYFVATSPGGETNGDLYVRDQLSNEFVFVPQLFGDENILRSRSYIGSKIPNINNPRTLLEDEYYVLGDNRSDSNDSASVGPILYEYVKGVAIAVEGTCTLVCEGDTCTAEAIQFDWPRSLKWKNV